MFSEKFDRYWGDSRADERAAEAGARILVLHKVLC
jgi:hypothetical protein